MTPAPSFAAPPLKLAALSQGHPMTLPLDAPKVYVSGPFTKGGEHANVGRAIRAAEVLLKAGFAPFVPHTMSATWEVVYPHSHAEWMALDLAWVGVCDAVLRLPGESTGADMETKFAEEKGIPVFGSVETLCHYFNEVPE